MTGLTLDTGALLAIERGDEYMRALLARAIQNGLEISVPAGVVAQAWRGGPRQARLSMLLNDPLVDVPRLDEFSAKAVGLVCGRTGHFDVIDTHVYLHARTRGHQIVTSDPGDFRKLGAAADLIVV